MSRVMEPPAQPPAGQGQPPVPPQQPEKPPEPWVLDDAERHSGRWIMDATPLEQSEQPAQPQAGQPAAPPAGVTQTPGAQPGQGVEYVLPTGHILRAPTWQGIADQLRNGLVALAQQQQQAPQRDYVRPPQEQAPAQQAPQQRQPFDGKRFYALLADEKPVEAMHALLQEYFGVEDPRQIASSADYAYSHAQKMNDRLETADFLSNNPDFPASDQSAGVLLGRLERDSVPLSRWNLEVAFHQLVREGSLQRLQAPAPQQPADYRANYEQPAPRPQSRGAGAPPLPGSGGGQTGDRELSDFEFEQLSTGDQKAYLLKRGLI